MANTRVLLRQHAQLTRRYFLKLGAAALAGPSLAQVRAGHPPELEQVLAELEYLTPEARFGNVSRGKPPPDQLPPEKLREVGLHPETWQLEIVADPDSDAKIERPFSKADGTAFTWADLMRLAETRAVRYLKVMTCLNGNQPLGMALWEGVPLRDVIWLTRPVENIRRVFYHGFHNDDPAQLFESSLSISRVLEDPPGTPPVILCYKMNGEWLTPKRGGPVRMVVPEHYGFKSVKWLNRIVLSNLFHANDTYARWNNDIDSPLKTMARFISYPKVAKAGQPIPVTGLAQVGVSGLTRVQVWIHPSGAALPPDDPYFSKGEWRDAEILAPPERWGGGLPDGRLPDGVIGIDPATRKPKTWPMGLALAHWAILLPGLPAGTYDLRCRTTDQAGYDQPMPRPFPKGGRNAIQQVTLRVEA